MSCVFTPLIPHNTAAAGLLKRPAPFVLTDLEMNPAKSEGWAAFLDLLRTTDVLTRGSIGVLKAEELSQTQYNVLRILRGAPQGLPCGESANRMITRDPDVTRLLDRMEKRRPDFPRARESRHRRMAVTSAVLQHQPIAGGQAFRGDLRLKP